MQHLLSAEAQPLPQQVLSLAQAKLLPIVFVQHVPPGATQMSPQQMESFSHRKESPCVLIHFTLSSSEHCVASVTGYLYPSVTLAQHLLPGAAHALPQQELPWPHPNLYPTLFVQHGPSSTVQTSPQHLKPGPQLKRLPAPFAHTLIPWLFINFWMSVGSCLSMLFNVMDPDFTSKRDDEHSVKSVTGYFTPEEVLQHLLSADAHVSPQQKLSFAQAKLFFSVFWQHVPPGATHISPQQEEPSPQRKESPRVFVQGTLSSSAHCVSDVTGYL